MEKTFSIAGGGPAADVTGMRRICNDLLSRVDDFVCRVDVIQNNIANTRQCSQLIDKVHYMPLTIRKMALDYALCFVVRLSVVYIQVSLLFLRCSFFCFQMA